MANYPDLRDKVVLLTGIGQQGDPSKWGNGAATCAIFISQGAKVFGCDINLSAAEHTRDRLRPSSSSNATIDVMATDVTKKEDVDAFVAAAMAKHGRIDVLVNNVGKSEPGDPASMAEEVWDAQMDVNLKSVYLCCHAVLPIMEKQEGGGAIVNVASVAGMRYIGKPQVAYAATKAAIMQFTKVTGVIYAKRGVRMNVVVPGLMDTPLVEILAHKYAGGDVEGYRKTREGQVPTGKMGDGFDVANAVVFLSSESAKYITGQKLVVDGGITSSTGRT